MNKLDYPDPSNGIRLYFEDLEYVLGLESFDSGVIQSVEDTLKIFSTDFIVSGCEDLGGNVTAEGWIMLAGELIRVKQHTRTNSFFEKITETNTQGDRQDNLGGSINVWEQIRATSTSATGTLRFDGITLNDILFRDITVNNITTAGIKNLSDKDKIVTVTSALLSTTTINVPDASESNKGHIISFNLAIDNLNGTLTIQDVSANNIRTYTEEDSYNLYLLILSDGSDWSVISEHRDEDINIRNTITSLVNTSSTTELSEKSGLVKITGTISNALNFRLPVITKARIFVFDIDVSVGPVVVKLTNNAQTLDVYNFPGSSSFTDTFTVIAFNDTNIVRIDDTNFIV